MSEDKKKEKEERVGNLLSLEKVLSFKSSEKILVYLSVLVEVNGRL
jgi:hypothetical protein